MPTFRRAVATATVTLALAAGLAGPASASPPEDALYCTGNAAQPATNVCLVTLTPGYVLPTVADTDVPVEVGSVCLPTGGCTSPFVVYVPAAEVTPGSGQVATLWYQERYYTVAASPVVVAEILKGLVAEIRRIVDGLPTTHEIIDAVLYLVDWVVNTVKNSPLYREVQRLIAALMPVVTCEPFCR